MYAVKCDGYNLLDFYNEKCTLHNPILNLEVNTVGGFTFTIYRDHPHFDNLKILRSVIEVMSGSDYIFRGRITSDTMNFDNGMTVDVEGVMAYLNDSIIKPFRFPEQFDTEGSGYEEAVANKSVVEFFLNCILQEHNAQVQPFQRFQLGRVTVADPDNTLECANGECASAWEVIKTHLLDSSLGGNLCIRYESDGNYIDYLGEFDEDNGQEVTLDTNMLGLKKELLGTDFFSAIMPIGADGLTVEGSGDFVLPGGDITKKGAFVYSAEKVNEYGWICAPTSETTWDDITDASDLADVSMVWLSNVFETYIQESFEFRAIDLHFTDETIEAFRMYRNVKVYSIEHGISGKYPITKMDIDLLRPQNTVIYAGQKQLSLLDRTSKNTDVIINNFTNVENQIKNVYEGVGVRVVETSGNAILPGDYYVFGDVDSLEVELLPKDGELAQEYCFEFTTTDKFTSFSECLKITPEIKWYLEPDRIGVEPESTYQVSVLRGIGVIIGA